MDRKAILEDLKEWLTDFIEEKIYALDVLERISELEEEYE